MNEGPWGQRLSRLEVIASRGKGVAKEFGMTVLWLLAAIGLSVVLFFVGIALPT